MTKTIAALATVFVIAGSSGAWALDGYDGNDDPIVPDNVQQPVYHSMPRAHYEAGRVHYRGHHERYERYER
jgi:hypothetical protein